VKIKASDIGLEKHEVNSNTALGQFVNQGFVLYKDVFDQSTVSKVREIVFAAYNRLVDNHTKSGKEIDNNGFAVSIIDMLQKSEIYN
jgi:hypothetical protein